MSNTYVWLFSLGAFASFLWLAWADPIPKKTQSSLPAIARIDAGLTVFVVGLLGARLGYVLMQFHFYSSHPEEILKFWNGGLTWSGGAVGVILGLSIYTIFSHHPFWRLADTLAMPAVLFSFALWFGCMLDGCTFGKPSDFVSLTPVLKDSLGTKLHRWPTQSTGAIFSLGILTILERVRLQKPSEGIIASLGLSLIAAVNFLLAFFRGDSVPILYGIRSDALASLTLFILGFLSSIYCFRKGTKGQHQLEPVIHE
jgi:phosphatidylglycerol:prolipoprotein diacylglycerol transferase